MPVSEAEALIRCMNRAIVTGAARMSWGFRGVDVRAVAAGEDEVLLILRAEDRTSAQLYRAAPAIEAIVDASPLAIFATDLQGRITHWNAAAERVFGWSRREALGQRLPFVPPARSQAYSKNEGDRDCGEGRTAVELSCVRKDGKAVEVRLWPAPLPDATGAPAGCITIVVDEPQSHEAQRLEAVGRLAGGVAHDFNNLLTVITGYGYMLLEQPEDTATVRSHAEEILKTAERASALTCQLLQFAKPRNAKPRPIEINELVREMEKMLRRVIGEHIELVTALSPEAGTISADSAKIEQVIMNLVVNARDAVPAGGRITIETASRKIDEKAARECPPVPPGDYAVLSVLDNGVGMDEETRARIFEPFFTTKGQGKGTGLGMATVYAIVKQSQGEITITSAPDRGTAIRIYLPRVRPPAPKPETRAEVSPRRRGTETVLLVEDEDEVRRLVSDVLEQHGYMVLAAARPQDAISLCASHEGSIDLLLTDAVMPQMSGRTLAEQAGRIRPNLRVLLMSGYAEEGPAGAFLRKPFTPAVLTRKVREVLDAGEEHRIHGAGT